MKEMNYDHELGIPAEAAWAVLADFGAFLDWNPLDVPYTVEGEGIGMVRVLDIPGLGRLGERLDYLNDGERCLRYSLTEGEPLGMLTYAADLRVQTQSDNSCMLHWIGRFTGADGADLDAMAQNLAGSYANMSSALERYVLNQGTS